MTTVPRQATDADHARRQLETLSEQVGSWLDHVPDPAAAKPETRGPSGSRLRRRPRSSRARRATPSSSRSADHCGMSVTWANAGAWRSATWLSVADHDEERIAWLCDIPLDTLRASDVEHDAYLYP